MVSFPEVKRPERNLNHPSQLAYLLTLLLTYSTKQSPSWVANWFSASQVITRNLWNMKVYFCCCKWTCPIQDHNIPSKNLVSPFLCLGRTKVSVQVRGFLFEHFVTKYVLRWGVVSTSPNPQTEGSPFVGCPRLLIQYIRSYPPYWRPFLNPQHVDAPCRGDREPLLAPRLKNEYSYLPTPFQAFMASYRTKFASTFTFTLI